MRVSLVQQYEIAVAMVILKPSEQRLHSHLRPLDDLYKSTATGQQQTGYIVADIVTPGTRDERGQIFRRAGPVTIAHIG